MTRIALDAETRGKLLELREPMELCDESGNVLGRFLPVADRSKFVPSDPQISEEEIQRRRQSKGASFSTSEVIKRLENT